MKNKNLENNYKNTNTNEKLLYDIIGNIAKNYKEINEKLDSLDGKVEKCLEDYEENKNAELMIIEKLENIGDFLRNNYNFVIEEMERFNKYPYDD